jgi:hypothetical protein
VLAGKPHTLVRCSINNSKSYINNYGGRVESLNRRYRDIIAHSLESPSDFYVISWSLINILLVRPPGGCGGELLMNIVLR